MGMLSDLDPDLWRDLYPGQLAADRAGVIARLREALRQFEDWTGYELPAQIRETLEPGDLFDLDEETHRDE
jgi:gamma-glutamylcysteine synthetase